MPNKENKQTQSSGDAMTTHKSTLNMIEQINVKFCVFKMGAHYKIMNKYIIINVTYVSYYFLDNITILRNLI